MTSTFNWRERLGNIIDHATRLGPKRVQEAVVALLYEFDALDLRQRQEDPLVPPHATEAERTVASIAAMLGWMNVPPRQTLEADIAALKARARRHEPGSAFTEWFPISTAPKDGQWIWVRRQHDPRHPKMIIVSAFKWDDRDHKGMWFAGTGWWHQFPMGFTHWRPMLDQPGSRYMVIDEEGSVPDGLFLRD